jgi:hypothetical protein
VNLFVLALDLWLTVSHKHTNQLFQKVFGLTRFDVGHTTFAMIYPTHFWDDELDGLQVFSMMTFSLQGNPPIPFVRI